MSELKELKNAIKNCNKVHIVDGGDMIDWGWTTIRDCNKSKVKYIQLLRKIEHDYNHSWPAEDDLTKQHRESILKEIREVLKYN